MFTKIIHYTPFATMNSGLNKIIDTNTERKPWFHTQMTVTHHLCEGLIKSGAKSWSKWTPFTRKFSPFLPSSFDDILLYPRAGKHDQKQSQCCLVAFGQSNVRAIPIFCSVEEGSRGALNLLFVNPPQRPSPKYTFFCSFFNFRKSNIFLHL